MNGDLFQEVTQLFFVMDGCGESPIAHFRHELQRDSAGHINSAARHGA